MIRRLPAAASSFAVANFPASDTTGVQERFTVIAEDPYQNIVINYTGTVNFTSSDPQAILPANYTFTAADSGAHTFTATLNKTGAQTISATAAVGRCRWRSMPPR